MNTKAKNPKDKEASCTAAIRALIHAIPKQYTNHHLHTAQSSDQHQLDLCTSNCWRCSTSHSQDPRQIYLKHNVLPCHAPLLRITHKQSFSYRLQKGCFRRSESMITVLFITETASNSLRPKVSDGNILHLRCRTGKLSNLLLAGLLQATVVDSPESEQAFGLQSWFPCPLNIKTVILWSIILCKINFRWVWGSFVQKKAKNANYSDVWSPNKKTRKDRSQLQSSSQRFVPPRS